MNSNLHPSAYGYQPQRMQNDRPLRPKIEKDTLQSGSVQVERKTFHFSLKENVRGRLLRITEDTGARHNSIIVPSTGLREFKKLLDEMVAAAEQLPRNNDSSPERKNTIGAVS
jgi:hypothetical protein